MLTEIISWPYVYAMKNLRAYAMLADLTNRDIADAFGEPAQKISRWLTRRTPVPDHYKARLAKMIGVTVEDLLPCSEIESGPTDEQEAVM